MVTEQQDWQLARCRQLIEEKLAWESAESWSTQDFEQLSELIAEQTNVTLSVTTLKRVWGRVKYESAPTTTTLNALVQFIGYENWQQFKKGVLPNSPSITEFPEPTVPIAPKAARPNSARRLWFGALLLVGLVVLSAIFLNYMQHRPLSPDDFSFSSQRVTKGIPNSVVFHYDATSSPTDSVFIQQSWDPRRRQRVRKNGHEHTSIYYYPGYFRAKLIIGNQIVQEHNLLIPSEGWNVSVMQEPVPVYFKEAEVRQKGSLGIPVAMIQQQNIPMQPKAPTVRYRYVRELGDLRSDNFTMETRLKNDFKQGSAICQRVTIMIHCKNEYFSIPLSAKGCVGDLNICLPGYYADARDTDLSAFGADLSQWVDVRCEVRNGLVKLFVNNKKAYEFQTTAAPKDIVGISYDFEGTGSVDAVRFIKPDGKVIFDDIFDSPILVENSK
ncbi:hypothetical protein GCM10028805_50380 [Spirosoma harenae]